MCGGKRRNVELQIFLRRSQNFVRSFALNQQHPSQAMVHISPESKTLSEAQQQKLETLEKKFQNAALEIGEWLEHFLLQLLWMALDAKACKVKWLSSSNSTIQTHSNSYWVYSRLLLRLPLILLCYSASHRCSHSSCSPSSPSPLYSQPSSIINCMNHFTKKGVKLSKTFLNSGLKSLV